MPALIKAVLVAIALMAILPLVFAGIFSILATIFSQKTNENQQQSNGQQH